METVDISETLVTICRKIRHHISENRRFYIYRFENLKSGLDFGSQQVMAKKSISFWDMVRLVR
jgi:hypothetical protein